MGGFCYFFCFLDLNLKNSFLTGKRGISLPFTDYCRPIAESGDQLNTLIEKLIEYGKQAGWMHLELRGGMNYLENSPAGKGGLPNLIPVPARSGSSSRHFQRVL